MTHEMKLYEDNFKALITGEKTREYRLYDEKRRLIKVGDNILFKKLPLLDEEYLTIVEKIEIFSNWYDCYATYFDEDFKNDYKTIDDVVEDTYRGGYYTKEESDKYGCCCITLKRLIKKNNSLYSIVNNILRRIVVNKNLYEEIKKYIPYNEQETNDQKLMLKFIEKFDDVLTRNNEFGHFVTSAWIVNKERTKVLMVHHNIYNSWSWIGGHADGEENLLEVCKQEINEETEIKKFKLISDGIFALSINAVKAHYKKNKFISSHLHYDIVYLFEADESEITVINNYENSGVKWLLIENVLDEVNEEHMKPIYTKLIEKSSKY